MTQPALHISFTPRFGIPDWLPEYIRRNLPGREVSFTIPRPVRLRMRHPEKMRVSEWAEKYRVVTDGAHEGPWRHDYAPHTVKIMDTFGQPWVREVWFCGVEQSGKTNTMLNCIGWAVDCDPGNIFYLMPTEDAAQKITGGKLKPTLQKSPRLARYLSRKMDDTSLARINLQHGVTIFPAHANSATSMATWSAKHCFGDEVDKYPEMAGKEADPITLIKKRNRTYKGRFKRFFASTPAGKFIYKETQKCHQVWEYRVKCPACGELIKMDAEHLVIPEGATPETVEQTGVDYACTCGSLWDDQKREQAIRHGRWLCVKGADIARPSKVGFHHRAWECLDIPLVEIAAAYLNAKAGDLAAKIAWANGYEAIDYTAELTDRKEDYILRLCDNRPEGLVPHDVDALTLHADTQDNGFWYTVRAWRMGETLCSWLVKAGFVDTTAALETLLYGDWYDTARTPHRMTWAIIDTQGHRTAEIYLWCLRTGVIPAAGAAGNPTKLVSVSSIVHFPGTNKPLPGTVRLHTFNTHRFKDDLASKLMIEPSDPGAWLLHSGYTEDQYRLLQQATGEPPRNNLTDYARHFCSEGRDSSSLWQNQNNKPNHLWDCEVMALVLAHVNGFHNLRREHLQARSRGPKMLSTGI
jgi:phage terminase large subunit GpA-like protein